jgi:GWxTD domain-containing protein
MKRPLVLAGLLLLGPALTAVAALTKYKDWDHSPEYVLLANDAEKKEWAAVKSDEDAEKFVALFWAKRDPDPRTPANEYKQAFDARVQQADQSFTVGKKRGALSERGKLLILVGPPKSVVKRSQGGPQQDASNPPGIPGAPGTETGGGGGQVVYRFHYEKAQLPEWAGTDALDAGFLVNEATQTESVLEGASAVKKIEAKAVEVALAHPELKTPPVYKTREQMEAEVKAASDAQAEANRGPTITPAVRQALDAALAKEPFGTMTVLSLAYRDGATHLMVQLLASGGVPSPENAKLAILVRTKDGKDAARREEAANLQKVKNDAFADRVFPLPPGDYDVAAVLLDATGNPAVTAHRAVTVAPLPTEFAASGVFLAFDDFALENPKLDDPFVFAQRKFVGRGDGRLEKADGLSYVIRVYNPAVDPANRTTLVKRTVKIKPKGGPAIDVPQAPEQPAPAPEAKDGKDVIVLDLAANIVPEDVGKYFKPGDYTLRITLTDGVSGKSVEATAPFTVVGSAAPEPAAPKPAPKPAPKKKGA